MEDLTTHEWPPTGIDADADADADAAAAAPVAVLVHGVAGWHRTWWRVGPAIAERGWRVVAVDQRGHGRSPRIDGHVTVGDLASDLGRVIEGIGAPVDALIGHSLGAAVSAELAYLRAELVRRLVLEDPPALPRTDDARWLANFERELITARTDFDGEVARELAENPAWLEEDARQDVEGKQLADREGIAASFRRETGARVPDLVSLLRIPTLYVLAAEDRSVYTGEARRRLLAETPANARLVVADAGHTVHRDRFEEYVTTVLDWIAPGR
jgi:pimeloyl-ACP methyl ester carboxylesterase